MNDKKMPPLPPRYFPEKAYKDQEFINSPDARPLRILAEYMEPNQRFARHGVHNTIVFFGSARLVSSEDAQVLYDQLKKDNAPQEELAQAKRFVQMGQYYDDAVELAAMLTRWSDDKYGQSDQRYLICSGGGPGIMEAANKGAHMAGGESVGLSISLPFEANANEYITPKHSYEFHYFFTRKYWFSYLAKALVIFPGGFGTLDELAEILTLIQTMKIKKKIPIVIYGSEFWNEVLNVKALAKWGTISPTDIDLLTYCDTPQDAFDCITGQIKQHTK
jgi:uncharacterized protein (TIGR00730 family)